jgi:hypothetical protein
MGEVIWGTDFQARRLDALYEQTLDEIACEFAEVESHPHGRAIAEDKPKPKPEPA